MEVLAIINTILRQYNGTNVEKIILAVLEAIQDNASLQRRMGERINPNGFGFALDLLGEWLGLPRPIVRDLFADYWGFQYDPVVPGVERRTWRGAPFESTTGDQYFRAHAGDVLYRQALRARARGIFGTPSWGKMISVMRPISGVLMYLENPALVVSCGGPVSSDSDGDSTWFNGELVTTTSKDGSGNQVLTGLRKFPEFFWRREGRVSGRANLPIGTIALSHFGEILYAITKNAVDGSFIHSINTETFEVDHLTLSIPAGIANLTTGIVYSDSRFLAVAGSIVYTCSWGASSARLNIDGFPSGTNITSLAMYKDEIWGIDANSRKMYRRNATTRQWSKISDVEVYPSSRTETPYIGIEREILIVNLGNYLSITPIKHILGYKRACAMFLGESDFGVRSMIDTIHERIIPRDAGVPLDYSFVYPNLGLRG